MASYRKRGNSYEIFFSYKNRAGEQAQGTETVKTKEVAERRCKEIEKAKKRGTFIPPNTKSIEELIFEVVDVYGVKKWSHKTYAERMGQIKNYILPSIGKKRVQKFSAWDADQFVHKMSKSQCVRQGKENEPWMLSPEVIVKMIGFLNISFNYAVRWNWTEANPFTGIEKPKVVKNERPVWEIEEIIEALDACENAFLFIAMHIAFACNAREGEICGMIWDNVHVSDSDIASDNARIVVDRELERITVESIDKLGKKDIYRVFPPKIKSNDKTRLVLKAPKTESSNRTIWIPATLAHIIREYKEYRDRQNKAFRGYKDYGLVIAHRDGTPIEGTYLSRAFNKLNLEHEHRRVVFHTIRALSTQEKLLMSNGDIKSVQGDNGHASAKMVTDVYSRIRDQDRKYVAQKFDDEVYKHMYSRDKAPLDTEAIIDAIKNDPEIMQMLVNVVSGRPGLEENYQKKGDIVNHGNPRANIKRIK